MAPAIARAAHPFPESELGELASLLRELAACVACTLDRDDSLRRCEASAAPAIVRAAVDAWWAGEAPSDDDEALAVACRANIGDLILRSPALLAMLAAPRQCEETCHA
jgi:hypothetical protein